MCVLALRAGGVTSPGRAVSGAQGSQGGGRTPFYRIPSYVPVCKAAFGSRRAQPCPHNPKFFRNARNGPPASRARGLPGGCRVTAGPGPQVGAGPAAGPGEAAPREGSGALPCTAQPGFGSS